MSSSFTWSLSYMTPSPWLLHVFSSGSNVPHSSSPQWTIPCTYPGMHRHVLPHASLTTWPTRNLDFGINPSYSQVWYAFWNKKKTRQLKTLIKMQSSKLYLFNIFSLTVFCFGVFFLRGGRGEGGAHYIEQLMVEN